jgi:hypothetical protein
VIEHRQSARITRKHERLVSGSNNIWKVLQISYQHESEILKKQQAEVLMTEFLSGVLIRAYIRAFHKTISVTEDYQRTQTNLLL